MKKPYSKVALLAAFAMLTGVAGNANAIVNLDSGTGNEKFASEAQVVSTGTTVAGEILNAEVKLGSSLLGSNTYILRLDLTGVRFAGGASAIYVGIDEDTTVAGDEFSTTGGQISHFSGGGEGDTYIEFTFTPAGNVTNSNSLVTFELGYTTTTPTRTTSLEVTEKTDATISYSLIDGNNNTKASATADYFSWGTAQQFSCEAEPAEQIDVSNPTRWADSTNPTGAQKIGRLTLDVAGVYDLTGASISLGGLLGTTSDYTLTGDFSAVGADLDGVSTYTFETQSDKLSAVLKDNNTEGDIRLTPNGNEMQPGSYSLTITPGTGSLGYDMGTSIDLGTCGSLIYSGSTDRLDFGLTPNGYYKQYVRIVNPSSEDGEVFMTVWNDSGDKVDFAIDQLTDKDGNAVAATLGAESSTGLIDINNVYTAAQAADETFEVGSGKMRIEVRGTFGDNAVDTRASFHDAHTTTFLSTPSFTTDDQPLNFRRAATNSTHPSATSVSTMASSSRA